MSPATLQHLDTNTLIGNTAHRGTAWHYRAEERVYESNHYPGPIPVADVERRLFSWQSVSRRVAVEVPTSVATVPRRARSRVDAGSGERSTHPITSAGSGCGYFLW